MRLFSKAGQEDAALAYLSQRSCRYFFLDEFE
jgi:hypothetical protein